MRKNNKNLYKMILDIVMTIIIVLLMKMAFIGVALHEILGIAVFVLFLIHKLLNIKIIKSLFNKFSQKNIIKKIIIIIDMILLIDITLIVLTGIIISQYIFNNIFSVSNMSLFSAIHHSSSYFGLMLISVHLGLHWNFVLNMFRKIFKKRHISTVRTMLSRITAVIIMLLGIKASFDQNVLSNLTEPFYDSNNSLSQSSTQIYNDNLLTDSNTSSDNQNYTIAASAVTSDAAPSLEEYLSSLFCTLCPKNCPLSSPICSKGEVLAQEATAEYYSLYGSSSSSLESDNIATDENAKDEDSAENYYHGKGNRRSRETSEDEDNINTSDNNDEIAVTDTTASEKEKLPIRDAFDYVSIMGLYIGGTHYLVKIPRKKK
ncbi:MAG: DUF4405 domain-containing protein [Eubacteriaceae bacterium]|nr:DUF4405 domain-containing protein [Eubacteriaceae bacterium]